MAAARQGFPVRLDRAPQRGAAFALASASRRAWTRSIGSRSTGSSLIFDRPPAVAPALPAGAFFYVGGEGDASSKPSGRAPSGTTNGSPAPGAGGAWSLGDSTHWSVSRNSVVIAQQFSNLFPGAIQRPYLGPTERLKA